MMQVSSNGEHVSSSGTAGPCGCHRGSGTPTGPPRNPEVSGAEGGGSRPPVRESRREDHSPESSEGAEPAGLSWLPKLEGVGTGSERERGGVRLLTISTWTSG